VKVTLNAETVAHAFLELLSLRGIEYFFANAGTDFASIVEAFALREGQGKPLDFGWISHNLARFMGDDTIVVNESGNAMEERLDYRPGGYFGPTHAGYLGWSFGTALGLKLAQPEKTVILTVGGRHIYVLGPKRLSFCIKCKPLALARSGIQQPTVECRKKGYPWGSSPRSRLPVREIPPQLPRACRGLREDLRGLWGVWGKGGDPRPGATCP